MGALLRQQPVMDLHLRPHHRCDAGGSGGRAVPGEPVGERAPYLVAVGADPAADCASNGLPYYAYNAGLSVMALTLEAEHQGLRVHQMAGWKENLVKTALGFPDAYRVLVVFALGYEGDPAAVWDQLDDRIKARLNRPRTRRPVVENFFFGAFNHFREPPFPPS